MENLKMNEKNDIPRDRRSKKTGHMANLIRRRMIQKDHGDMNKYTRKIKHKGKDEL